MSVLSSIPSVQQVRPKGVPCKVCGDEASGFHYGVDSCEGCKGFFRRCLTQGMNHKCVVKESCEITPFSRNSCQFCRLKKCFEVGMSREASRLGRRPKRLKESQELEAAQNAKKMEGLHPFPSPIQMAMNMSDMQGFMNSMANERVVNVLSSPIYQLDGLPVITNTPSNGFLMNDMELFSGNLGDVIPSSDGLLHENLLHDSFLLSPGINSGATSMSRDDLQCFNKALYCSPGSMLSQMRSQYESEMGGLCSPRCHHKCHMKDAIGYIDREGRIIFTEAVSGNDFPNIVGNCMQRKRSLDVKCPVNSAFVGKQFDGNPSREVAIDSSKSPECVSDGGNSKVEHVGMLWSPVPKVRSGTSQSLLQPQPIGNAPMSGLLVQQALEAKVSTTMDDPNTESMIEDIIKTIVDAHKATCLYTSDKVAVGMKNYEEMVKHEPLNRDTQHMSMFAKSSDPLKWWEQFVENMTPVIQRVVKFSKKLPGLHDVKGFLELSQDDQITLIKKRAFEVILARYTLLFSEKGMFLPNMRYRIPRDKLKEMPMGDFFEEQFKFADIFNQLKLDDAETALMTGIMIMNPECDDLKKISSVEKLRGLYLKSLYFYMKRERPENYGTHFDETISTLPLLDNINDMHSTKLHNMSMTAPDLKEKLPDLHKEVFGVDLEG